MGMGRVNPNTSSGMSGKGGAARPATPTAPQPGMGGKGVGQQPPQQVQPQPGMGGKGMGQLPPQSPMQPGMGGKGMGAGVGPTNPLYDFPMINQPPQVQPVAGMSGKGGTQQINPAMQPYIGSAIGRPYQQPPQVQPGMGGKGVGRPEFGVLNNYNQQRAAFDAANPQPVNNPNDPYAARFGVPDNYVGTPAPVQQPMPGMDKLPSQYGGFGVNQPPPQVQPSMPTQQDLMAQQAYNAMNAQSNSDMNQQHVGQQQDLAQVLQQLRGLPQNPGQMPRPPMQQQIAQPNQRQEMQRALQQFRPGMARPKPIAQQGGVYNNPNQSSIMGSNLRGRR